MRMFPVVNTQGLVKLLRAVFEWTEPHETVL